jgi:two-component system, chemotaxis family, sensor kinase CheA
VVVLRFGSSKFALAVDRVLNTEEIVAKPIHPMLKSLAIYSGATLLGDGSVAMILSSEGLGRYMGLSSRASQVVEVEQPRVDEAQRLLLLRYGPDELLALPVGAVRRVLMVTTDKLKPLGQTFVVDVGGQIVELLRPDTFLPVSAQQRQSQSHVFVVLPRRSQTSRALLVSQVIGTVDRPVNLDTQTIRADGVLGVAMIDNQPAMLLDFHRLLDRAAGIESRPADTARAVAAKVLVVDDTQFFRQLETTYLMQTGCTVTTANDGREAVERLQKDKSFDLVVSDLEMPRLDGFGFARAARSMGYKGPMLACSTLSDAQSFARAKAAGFDRQLVKLDRDEFLAVVNEMLAGKSKGVA